MLRIARPLRMEVDLNVGPGHLWHTKMTITAEAPDDEDIIRYHVFPRDQICDINKSATKNTQVLQYQNISKDNIEVSRKR